MQNIKYLNYLYNNCAVGEKGKMVENDERGKEIVAVGGEAGSGASKKGEMSGKVKERKI